MFVFFFSLLSDLSGYWGAVVARPLYDAIMFCLAGRHRPQPAFTSEISLKPAQHTSGTDPRSRNASGYHSSGSQSINIVLSTAKPILGQTGCTDPGSPCGTRYRQRDYPYNKFAGLTAKRFSTVGGGRGKASNKNAANNFLNLGRCSLSFSFQSRWMAFLALFVLLQTKAGMTPRVAAALRFDGQQALSVVPQDDIYTPETESQPNDTALVWRRLDLLNSNDRVRKADPSSVGALVPAIKRSFGKQSWEKRQYSPDVTRPYARAPRKQRYQYKTYHQHYNYYHPHYHHSNKLHRPTNHKNHSHSFNKPASQEKRKEYENEGQVGTNGDGQGSAYRRSRRSADTDKEFEELDPLERLSRVFGIRRLPSQNGPFPTQIPPEYMTRLYRSITDSGGLSKTNGPYNADIVRSFPDRDYRHQMHFFYNVSFLESNERILQAEFHLFKLKPKYPLPKKTNSPHLISIEIHQVMSLKDVYNPDNLKLIDMRRVGAYTHGWIIFTVVKAVNSWVNNTSPNYGFLVKATSLSGEILNGTLVRFAQRKEHHDTKQPILVLFTDDGLQKHRNFISPSDEGYQEIKRDILRHEQQSKQERSPGLQKAIRLLNEKERTEYQQQKHGSSWGLGFKRKRRSAPNSRQASESHERRNSTSGSSHGRNRRTLFRRKRRNCARYEMYVDFNAIGWSGWIISPKGYNAYHCSGPCPFPLGQSHRPTNHATVQSIVHALRAGKNVLTPCCVPDKLYSISLLYFDDQENVILKLYEDMVAASCGCH